MQTYKVIQWATAVVGTSCLKGVVRHPKLELVGVKVYSDKKQGLDAGELMGGDETGVIATRDIDEILALDADCVLYCPLPWHTDEICRLLESGKHVITPCPYYFPFIQNPEAAAALKSSCEKGNVNFHASGCNPGGIAERFPLTFTGWCNRIARITMTECGDCRTYSSEGVMRELMNLGKTPAQAAKNFILSNQPIETAVGVIEEGTIALNHYQHIGITADGTEIIQEQIWYCDDIEQTRLQSKMEIPRQSGWRIKIEGDVNLNVDIDFPSHLNQDERVAQGLSTTAFHLMNAVPLVCDAPNPGIKTFLDLPMITGCMGSHALER